MTQHDTNGDSATVVYELCYASDTACIVCHLVEQVQMS